MDPLFKPRSVHATRALESAVELISTQLEPSTPKSLMSRPSYRDFVRFLPEAAAWLFKSPYHDREVPVDPGLIALLDLRAALINGCLLCVHHALRVTRRARVAEAKIEAIGAWHPAGVFSASERAALFWAEHLAGVSKPCTPDSAWLALKHHFGDVQLARLFSYWDASQLWAGDDVLQCCTASPNSSSQS